MRNLLALLLFLPSLCLAQIPNHIPTEGLQFWSAFDGNATDESTQEGYFRNGSWRIAYSRSQ